MSVNTSIYGTPEQWFDYQTTNFDDEAMKFKQAYIGNGGKRLQDGFGYGIALNKPIDMSLSWCGLGNFSAWSKISYYKTSEDMALIAQDDRTATNFSLNATNGTYTGVYIGDVGTVNGSDTMYYGSIQRWSPKAVNSYSSYTSNYSANVEPLTQIPLRNCVMVPYFRVAKQINSANNTTGMDIRNVFAWDYYGTTATGNHTTHPYILAITMMPYHLGDKNASTRTPTGAWRASSILDEISLQKGIPKDFDRPDQEIMDMVYCYNIFSQPSTINGWTIFGHTVNGAPVGGVSNADIIGFTDANAGFGSTNSNRTNTIRGVVVYNHPNEVFSTPFTVSQSSQGSVTVTTKGRFHYVEYYDNGDNDNIKEWVRKQIACFGLFFTDDKTTAETGEFNDPLMCLGILDDNNIGQGFYSMGEDNENQKQWNWETTNDSEYDPSGGGGNRPRPEPGENPKGLHTPGFSLAVDNGSVNYIINQSEWSQIWDDIYGGSKNDWEELINGLALYGSNPLNAILNYRWYPFEFTPGTPEQLRLGASLVGPSTHKYGVITAASQGFKSKTASFWCGSIDGFDKDFVNIRKTKCRVWLPFYGFYELPMTMVINHSVDITFQYSIPDDMGIWEIAFGGSMWDFVECQPFVEIPITGDNSLQIAAEKAQRNLSIAMTAGAAIVGAAIGGAAGLAKGVIASGFGTAADIAESGILGTASVLWGNASYGELAMGLGGAAIGTAVPLAGGGIKAVNTVMQSALQIGNLSTNLPTHTGASDTTFLNLPLSPFIEFYIPLMQDDYDAGGYKETTGIACDKWVSLNSIGDKLDTSSLLQTTGIADMDTSGMELDEINELNSIVQSGFWL